MKNTKKEILKEFEKKYKIDKLYDQDMIELPVNDILCKKYSDIEQFLSDSIDKIIESCPVEMKGHTCHYAVGYNKAMREIQQWKEANK